jgi:sugar phosphate isomerase/epimerase
MKTSVFSTSLTALDLREAIRVAAEVGYEAMEVGCFAPHLTLEMAEARGDEVRAWLRDAGLPVSALSLDVSYTDEDEDSWRANVDETCRFIELCERFGTRLMKIMPGPPGHAEATDGHWARFGRAMDVIVPAAESAGVRLALETHLNHLSDSIQSTARCLECGPSEVLGVNLDFCNVRTCGDDPLDALERFQDRLYLTHVKDSRFNLASGEYVPMGEGEMDYPPLIERLREVGYDRYLSVECLYPWAKRDDPRAAVSHDLAALRGLLVEGRA